MRRYLVLFAVPIVLNLSCLENPFGGDDEISGGTRSLRGKVNLSNGAASEDAYVWLEGFNLGTYVNAQGEFNLTLPPAGSQGSSGGASGIYRLYFFMSNYLLKSSGVVTRNGAFVYGQGEVNKNGELNSAKSLERFLRISTAVSPATVASNYNGTIAVETALEATIDTATVVFPKTLAGLLGAVLIRRVGGSEVYIMQAVPGASTSESQRVGRSPYRRGMTFNFTTSPLPPGDYEVVPYILLRRQTVPSLLLANLGGNLEDLTPNYLNLPMKREGGQFKVTP